MVTFELNVISLLDLVFCAIIFILGAIVYLRHKNLLAFVIAITFGLFGVSHIISMTSLANMLQFPLLVIRATAYTMIIIALFNETFGCKLVCKPLEVEEAVKAAKRASKKTRKR